MRHLIYSFYLSLLCTLLSCDRPKCQNTNAVFDNQRPGSMPYNEELIIVTGQNRRVTYYFDRYEEKEGMEYIYVNVVGDSICASAVLTLLDNKSGLDELRKVKGNGYSGAELRGLKYSVYKESDRTELIFSGVDDIID